MQIDFGIVRSAAFCLVPCVVAPPALALPPNPERPVEARTCVEARARLAEARAGNPLISAEEMVQVVARAEAQVARLCGPEPATTVPSDCR